MFRRRPRRAHGPLLSERGQGLALLLFALAALLALVLYVRGAG